MDFRIKNLSVPSRQRIKLSTLKDLLQPEQILKAPQENLTDALLFRSTTSAQLKYQKQQIARFRSSSSSQLSKGTKNKQISAYSLRNKERKLDSLRKTYYSKTNQTDEQPNFSSRHKYRSIEQEYERSKSLRNIMWTPILYLSNQNTQNSREKSQNLIRQHKQRIHKRKLQYLKKGTDINRRVVVNLLKLKLGRQGNRQSQEDKTIRNQQILRMIKICKGYGQNPDQILTPNYKSEVTNTQHRLSSKQKKQIKLKLLKFGSINMEVTISEWQRRKSNYTQNQQNQEII